MNDDDEKFLEKYGWVVECKSPFEISLEEDPQSRATGAAADLVLEYLRYLKGYDGFYELGSPPVVG